MRSEEVQEGGGAGVKLCSDSDSDSDSDSESESDTRFQPQSEKKAAPKGGQNYQTCFGVY